MTGTGDAERALLDANAEFYTVFRRADREAMAGLWSRREPVTCIHPGWPALFGRRDVLESWRGILDGDNTPAVECRRPVAHIVGELGYVICYEALDGHLAAATNLFRLENGRWLLVHHQATVCAVPAANANTTLQ